MAGVALFCAFATELKAFELLGGASFEYPTLAVYANGDSHEKLAQIETDTFYVAPTLSMRTRSRYLGGSSHWAYAFSFDFATSKLTKQRLEEEGLTDDFGTDIDALSVFITPLLYYQFNECVGQCWQYRIGVNAGLGYQSYKGTVQITNIEHPEYLKIIAVEHQGVDLATGLYAEASYNRHHIIFQGNLLATTGGNQAYVENSVHVIYLIRFYWKS